MRKILFFFYWLLAVYLFSACSIKAINTTQVNAVSGTTDGHPAWIMQGNIYEVNVRQYTPEGTFNAFAQHLTRLKDMGVQTLWFMPITPVSKVDRKGALGSYYAVADYKAINPEFGTMEDWKALVKKCHAMGFKVITDWVANHTGGDNNWLTTHPNFYLHDSSGKVMSQFDWTDTRKLNYSNSELIDSMIDCMKFWINESGIDGFRCDVAGEVPDLFWKKCISELRKEKNVFMLAEGNKPSLHDDGFDATYAWDEFNMMKLIAKGERPAFALDSVLKRVDATFPKNSLLMYFTSNHDENSWNKADYETMPGASHAPFAIFTQTAGKSVPLIYSGQEEPFLDSISFFYKDTITFGKYQRAAFYKTLLLLRKVNPALAANATFIKIETNDNNAIYAYMRQQRERKVLCILNFSNQDQMVTIKSPDINGNPLNVFTGNKETLKNDNTFNLAAWQYLVYSY